MRSEKEIRAKLVESQAWMEENEGQGSREEGVETGWEQALQWILETSSEELDPKATTRFILKDGTEVGYVPEDVKRIEIETGSTTWWIETAVPLWWIGRAPALHLLAMGSTHEKHPIIMPSSGNAWWLSELDSGYTPQKGPFDE